VDRQVSAVARWWLRPAPLARVAVFRTIVYLFVPIDLFARTGQVLPHAYGSKDLYDPVELLAAIHQPAPTPMFVHALLAVIIASSLVAATGALRRVAGWVVALAFLDWCCLAMSYGKVDHDHLAILVAVFVLPTVGGASVRSTQRSEAAGWALRCVEVAVIATYFLSAYAKVVRFGHPHWLVGATFAWAVVRRGTFLARPLLHHPWVLLLAQWGLFALETLSPVVLFLGRRARIAAVVLLEAFHVMTEATIRINFVPLMVCLLVFLPLEDLAAVLAGRLHSWHLSRSPGRRSVASSLPWSRPSPPTAG
jgi:hypothetical protein